MSPDLITVKHPFPVRFMPRTGKFERTGFVMTRTPVHLRDIGPAAVTDLIRWGNPRGGEYALVGTDNGIWFREGKKAAPDAAANSVPRFVERAGEAAFEGPDLAGTPLQIAHYRIAQKGLTPVVEALSAIPGEVIESYETEARAALMRFFEQDVLVAGGDILYRARPLAKLLSGSHAWFETHPVGTPDLVPCCGLDRIREANAAIFGVEREVVLEAPLGSAVEAAEGRLLGDEDLRHYANSLPGSLWKVFTDHNPRITDDQREAGAYLRRLEALGSIGAVGAHEWDVAISKAVQYHEDVIHPWASKGRPAGRYDKFTDLVAGWVKSRLDEMARKELVRWDVEALASLGT